MIKPRLLVIIADSSHSGAPTQVAYLIRGLHERYEIHLAAPAGWLSEVVSEQATVHTLPATTAANLQHRTLQHIIRKVKPYLVHCHGVRGGLWGRLAADKAVQPVLYTEHLWTSDFHLSNRYRERLQISSLRWLERRTTHTIAVSDSVEQFLLTNHLVQATGVTRIYGAIEPLPVCNHTGQAIGCLGSLQKVKGADLLLEAFALLKNDFPQLTCHIGGSGPEEPSLRALALKLGIAERVVWHGAISDLNAFFATLSVYVQPSRSESFGLAPLEAMSTGLPVVASTAGALPELITNGKTGYLFERGKSSALAEVLRMVLPQPDLLAEAGADHARSFSIAKMAEAHHQLYQQYL